ncbi:HAD family hydrolase [Lunatimonas salinarum]|uniref:HAD family hydrolase n=1 Tax=Lunatimonas salinarum TaxID=1774590 RepID=UPI001AE0B961|nr:HAD family hydrolase [Lunatimonas salinarum]
MTLLVLDLDGTLTKSDNLVRFTFFMMNKKWRFVLAIPLLFLLKIKLISNTKFKKVYARLILKGFEARYIQECANEYARSQEFGNDLNQEVLSFIKKYPQSAKVVISANFEFLVDPICEVLGIKDFSAIKLEVQKERYNGSILGLIPYGKDKINALNHYLGNIDYKTIIGLVDSPSDSDLLRYLNEGFLVSWNKDQKLTNIISVDKYEKKESF